MVLKTRFVFVSGFVCFCFWSFCLFDCLFFVCVFGLFVCFFCVFLFLFCFVCFCFVCYCLVCLFVLFVFVLFCQMAQNFVLLGSYDFTQISPARGRTLVLFIVVTTPPVFTGSFETLFGSFCPMGSTL